jgi:hypothetical protein
MFCWKIGGTCDILLSIGGPAVVAMFHEAHTGHDDTYEE